MTINPYILLGIGSVFALLYAATITFGWALTRRARRAVRDEVGLSTLPVFNLAANAVEQGRAATTISLTRNHFEDAEGNPIDPSRFDVYIAAGHSDEYPNATEGDLLLFDRTTHQLTHAIPVPDLKDYR